MTRRQVVIGSFVADSDDVADHRATLSLAGWGDAPPIRLAADDRTQQHGGWDASGFFSARVINYQGSVSQSTREAALERVDELQALWPTSLQMFSVIDPFIGVRSAMVRVLQGAAIDWVNPTTFRYTMQLRAADMLKYGDAWYDFTTLASAAVGTGRVWPRVWPRDWGVPAGATPGSVSVPNAGKAPYWTRLRIDGPVTNPVIRVQETGDSLRLIQPDGDDVTISAGQWFDIDSGERHVTFGANADDVRYLADVTGTWLAVPPGGATFTFEADGGTTDTTLSVYGYEGAWA